MYLIVYYEITTQINYFACFIHLTLMLTVVDIFSDPLVVSITERIIEGRTGGVSGTVHGRKKSRITDHGYQNVIFTNHENKQVSCSFS